MARRRETVHHLITYLKIMADPVLGSDVIIQFNKNDSYFNYGCATSVEIQFAMETKSVKTIGDGAWKRVRCQSKSLQIQLEGIIKADEELPVAFDLLDYFKNMVDVQYRLLFYDETGVMKVIEGYALPVNVNLGGGSEGHATGSITLVGNGDPDAIFTPPDPGNPDTECEAEIATAHIESVVFPPIRKYFFVDTMVSGSATISRWDYTIDGGGIQTKFTDGSIPTSWILPFSVSEGVHTIVVTPICENGFSGTPFTLEFGVPGP